VNDDAQRPSGSHFDSGLDGKILGDQLLACLRSILLRRFAQCPDEIAFVAAKCQLGANAQQRRKGHALDEPPCAIIDLVGKPGIARRIRGGRIVDPDRRAIGEDDSLPDEHRPALPERDHAIIAADQPRSLRQEQNSSAGAVIDILGQLRGHKARQVGIEPGDQARRYDAPCRKDVGRGCSLQAMGIYDLVIAPGFGKGDLVALCIGIGLRIEHRPSLFAVAGVLRQISRTNAACCLWCRGLCEAHHHPCLAHLALFRQQPLPLGFGGLCCLIHTDGRVAFRCHFLLRNKNRPTEIARKRRAQFWDIAIGSGRACQDLGRALAVEIGLALAIADELQRCGLQTGLVTVLCRSPISLCHLRFECERADATQI
jgi:hypothetical protein